MMRVKILVVILLSVFVAYFLVPLFRNKALASNFFVTTSSNAGRGSLRVAITNANDNPGADTIIFNIPTTDPGYSCEGGNCWWTIQIATSLPDLTDDYTFIDGLSQTANQGNTNPAGLEIAIDGSLLGGTMSILAIESDHNVVQGMAFHSAPGPGVRIITLASYNTLAESYIGTSPTGTRGVGDPDLGNASGVEMTSGANHNTINHCIISDNTGNGVLITGSSTDFNTVKASYIGLDSSGEAALPNGGDGILIYSGSSDNTIGGSTGEGNVISANNLRGILIDGIGTDSNDVKGNYIGIPKSGSSAVDVGNLQSGVMVTNGSWDNWIFNNVISGNHDHGVYIFGAGTQYNYVQKNLVGTGPEGKSLIPNHHHGIALYGGTASNDIGDYLNSSYGNVVAGNGWSGIVLQESSDNIVYHNAVGTDRTGAAQNMGNVYHGVVIEYGSSNTIAKNIIAFNGTTSVGYPGLVVSYLSAKFNTISQNSIHDNAGIGIRLEHTSNQAVPPPILHSGNCESVTGQSSEQNAIIEIFSDNHNEGRIFEGSTVSSSGSPSTFSWTGTIHGPNVTATLTDVNGNTSQFSSTPVWNACNRVMLPLVLK
jgi:parallel beta-helix repeat protein